ncbi:MAG: ZIP family metal transporter [Methylomonas sp.]|nr:ZIP family metal transporter [Methylomonas sp.]
MLALWLRRNDRAIAGGIGFSAGIMILISFIELIPEARAGIGLPAAIFTALSGAFLLWIMHTILPHTHLIKEHSLIDPTVVKSVYLVVFGLILHDVPEGFAMANAYISSPSLGVLVAIAIALHNLPEEFALCIPVVALKSRRFLFGTALLSALAEPVGALLGLLANEIAPVLNPFFLSFAAGAMIFVSVHELLPLARRYGALRYFIGGITLSVAVYRLLAWAITG